MQTQPKQGVINVNVPTDDALYKAYMPFLKNGGLFVASTRAFELGDEVFLLLTLPGDPHRHGVSGRVAWINPKPSAQRPVGIGVQFIGMEAVNIQQKIETILAGQSKSDQPTHTL